MSEFNLRKALDHLGLPRDVTNELGQQEMAVDFIERAMWVDLDAEIEAEVEAAKEEAFADGRSAGYEEGHDDGYDEGYRAAKEEADAD